MVKVKVNPRRAFAAIKLCRRPLDMAVAWRDLAPELQLLFAGTVFLALASFLLSAIALCRTACLKAGAAAAHALANQLDASAAEQTPTPQSKTASPVAVPYPPRQQAKKLLNERSNQKISPRMKTLI